MTDVTAIGNGRPRRSRRTVIRADRLPGTDMRGRRGRQYLAAYRAACLEFAGADPDRIASVVRLRLLAEKEEIAALAGKASVSEAVRTTNVAVRAARDLKDTLRGKPAPSGSSALQTYLDSIRDDVDADDGEPAEATP